MSTVVENLTGISTEGIMEEEFVDFFEDEELQMEIPNSFASPISVLEGMAMAISVFSIGIILNSIILRCYWKDKTAMSAYYRAFSVIDMLLLAVMLIRQICLSFWPIRKAHLVFTAFNTFMVTVYNFCPLVLAMDRCLIVSFPHNFCKYERKLRYVKQGMILLFAILAFIASLAGVTEFTTTPTYIFRGIMISISVLQIIVIVVLYGIIIV